ncbi:hypothetical protein BCV69DRAFT_217676 [Microstroma glucosiphilum]|uniref:Uncharacterized protein n=1 Tax=Pseudomicrostroma glucosiphilum TaxID=1684307 RepID=A0A316U4E9_9BASI|nr:hypothetical protein BCV69DRAFT_217676 [Pseudomicrostroma glucosiphilum]PWN20060.1 hypothetical protein BCV69DRAFT_217676 [Pseudomicrostroma glucosiphilum]
MRRRSFDSIQCHRWWMRKGDRLVIDKQADLSRRVGVEVYCHLFLLLSIFEAMFNPISVNLPSLVLCNDVVYILFAPLDSFLSRLVE